MSFFNNNDKINTGDRMRALLIGINAKYIHPNLAIRLLKKNTTYDTDIKEFTIKDDINKIISFIDNSDYDVIAFSCYIWNINIIKNILKKIKHNKIIVLGGPEVSYNPFDYIDNNLCDYVIKNEGEEAFNLLLSYLDKKTELELIPNLYYNHGFTYDKLVDLSSLKMAYDLLDDLHNKIVYIETSRGCPYKCAYCMASLDNKVRFFNMDEIKKQLKYLQSKGARVYKFLDRTFNANKKFIELIDYIVDNHIEGESYQFEITGDLLKPEYIDYINNHAPKNLIRFEIGIQSTNIEANLAVGRIQNNKLLFSNIIKIQDADIIDLHLDLIAGLPKEDYSSFIKTFNDCIALRPKELQLGFLKLLHGTRLYNEAQMHNYIWDKDAPYEIISNDYLNEDDIKEIHYTEDSFDHYYNSNLMRKSMLKILDNEDNPFLFFNGLGKLDFKHKGLENLFKTIDDYVKGKKYYNDFHKTLIIDYLNYFNLKPKAWWDEALTSKEKNKIIRELFEKNLLNDTLDNLYKYSMVIPLNDYYIIAIYKSNYKNIIEIKRD